MHERQDMKLREMYCVGNSGTFVVRTYFLLCFTAQDLTLQMSEYFFLI